MRKFLSRLGVISSEPVYTERWNDTHKRIELVVPFVTSVPDNAQSAADLSDAVIAAVRDIQNGTVGSSLPQDVAEAHAAIVIEPQHRELGDLELQAVEILRERLGSSIAVDIAELVAVVCDDDEQPSAQQLVEPEFVWDQTSTTFRGRIDAPARISGPPATYIRRSFDRLMAKLSSKAVQELAPAQDRKSARYEITVVLPRGTRWDQQCTDVVNKIDDALLKTRVTFRVENG